VATEGGGIECPVCGEGFREKPSRCFRCESDLELWWPLHESLQALDGLAVPVSVPATSGRTASRWLLWPSRNAGWLMPVVLLAGLAGAAWLSLESTRPVAEGSRSDAPTKPRPRPVAPEPDVAPVPPSAILAVASPAPLPRTIRYVVQPGDSLWRIAAALKGDARRWPELVASGQPVDPARLQPGQELRIVVEGAP
jgi:LysM domain